MGVKLWIVKSSIQGGYVVKQVIEMSSRKFIDKFILRCRSFCIVSDLKCVIEVFAPKMMPRRKRTTSKIGLENNIDHRESVWKLRVSLWANENSVPKSQIKKMRIMKSNWSCVARLKTTFKWITCILAVVLYWISTCPGIDCKVDRCYHQWWY